MMELVALLLPLLLIVLVWYFYKKKKDGEVVATTTPTQSTTPADTTPVKVPASTTPTEVTTNSGGVVSQTVVPPSSTPTTVVAPTPAPTTVVVATPVSTISSACNKSACNSVMQDWTENKYWAYSDTAKSFAQCASCPSRWFRSPMDTSKDGVNWATYPSRNAAYLSNMLV